MDKRTFIKKGMIGAGGIVAISSFSTGKAAAKLLKPNRIRDFRLPGLPYAYNALEPYINEQSLRIHHTKYHADYTARFNQAVKESGLSGKNAREILSSVSAYSDSIRKNGGGFFNHKLFWRVLSPDGGGMPGDELLTAICIEFGSFDNFKIEFTRAANNHAGSGWTWLILSGGKLSITNTAEQDNPVMDIASTRGRPLLMIDICDHACDMKNQDNRNKYIDNFWNIVNWEFVSNKYNRLQQI